MGEGNGRLNPLAPRNFDKKCSLKLVELFSGHVAMSITEHLSLLWVLGCYKRD